MSTERHSFQIRWELILDDLHVILNKQSMYSHRYDDGFFTIIGGKGSGAVLR